MRPSKYRKARELVRNQKVRCEGLIGSSVYFKVQTDSLHDVIFKIPGRKWLCDCEYYTRKGKDCSHILACKMFLIEREGFKK